MRHVSGPRPEPIRRAAKPPLFSTERRFVLAAGRRRSYSWKMAGVLDGARQGKRMSEEAVSGPFGFFASRWRRQVPLGLLFWRDMIVVGSAINLAALFAFLVALGLKSSLPMAMLVLLAPLPYNVFLVATVWRAADLAEPGRASTVRAVSALWLVLATLL
jgi:hypothetical protein